MTGPQVNPLAGIWGNAPSQQGNSNPLADLWSSSPIPELKTGRERESFNYESLLRTRDQLKAIQPANPQHAERLRRLISSIDTQIAGGAAGDRGAFGNFVRGTAKGFAQGLEFPVELAGDAASLLGNKSLQNYIEENRALLQEHFDPQGGWGTAGEVVGGIAGSLPGAGGAASATGEAAIRLLPSSRIAKAIALGTKGTIGQRVATNVVTGLPINAAMSFGGPEMEVPQGASPEESQRIGSLNTANKIKQFAIGIGADAAFGAIPHGKAQIEGDAPKSAEIPVLDQAPLTPERQAQLDKVKAQNAVKVAAKKSDRLNKKLAESEWQILNPTMEFKELDGKAKRKVYDDYTSRRSDAKLNTSGENTPENQVQLVAMEQQLKDMRGERDEATRVAETDSKLGIGNDRALMKASKSADTDKNSVYIFADVNGQKAINDTQGYEAGDRLLMDSRDAMIGAIQSYGVKPRVFRYGGDELVAIVPREHAQTILDQIENRSVKQYGDQTGSLSGAIHETLTDALSTEGKAALTARKIEAKARQNIPGRSNEEQTLIDAARVRINTAAPEPVVPSTQEYLQGDPAKRARVQAMLDAGTPIDPMQLKQFPDLQVKYGDKVHQQWEAFKQTDAYTSGEYLNDTAKAPVEDTRTAQEVFRDENALPVDAPFPPEVMATIDEIHSAGGLQDEEAQKAFATEVKNLYDKDMTPEKRAEELQALVEDFTPLERQVQESKVNTPLEVTPVAPEIQAQVPSAKETRLQSIEHKKPLEAMSEKELSRVDDKLTDALDSIPKGSAEYSVIQSDFDAVRDEYARRNGSAKAPERIVEEPAIYGGPEVAKGPRAEKIPDLPSPREDAELIKLMNKSVRKMSDSELNTYIDTYEGVRRNATDYDVAEEAQRKMDKAMQERALRAKVSDIVMPQVPKSAIDGTMGFMFGFAVPSKDGDDELTDRTTNALMWALVGAGGIAVARMAVKARAIESKVVPSDHWAGSEVADKKLVSYQDTEKAPKSWRERSRDWYQGIARRSFAIDNAVNVLTGDKRGAASIPAHRNPAKLAAIFGRWVSQSEGALMDRPTYLDYAGNVIPLPAQSFREISDMVGGDIKGLGKLMAARASLEGEGLRRVPLDPITSNLIMSSAGEEYHKAADAMRQLDLAMSSVLEMSGVLSPGTVDRFSKEELFASLKRAFDPETGPSKMIRDSKGKVKVTSQNPVKGRAGGHSDLVYNPAETTASMIPQIYRAAELNNIKMRLVDLWEAAGKPDWLLKQAERRKEPVSVDQQMRIDFLKQDLKGSSSTDAEALVAAFDPKSLDPRSNVMTVYRDGVLRAYKVDENVAQSMASLTPDELEGMWKVLGLPASIAKQGVVLNPYFVAKQSFIDGWQATLNSQYGFRPGVDQFIGWMHIVRDTPQYKEFIEAGGGHSTLQSGDFANVKSALKAVGRGDHGPLGTAVAQAREFKLLDAYRTLVVPFAESARMGEFLRAKDHGASALDAVYAAKHVTANFQQRGGFQMMRGLDRASMFLNPAIQGLDQAMFRAGVNPFRVPEEGRRVAASKYLSKAFIGITLPSMAFWFMNKDDQEINDLRKTQSGSKYWFMRSPVDNAKMGLKQGDIVKIPKPIVDGQIFGTTMEAYLDKKYGDDPAMIAQAGAAIAKDVGFNILPTAGVLYYGLQTGQNIGMGGPLVGSRDENLSLEHQGEDKASWVARSLSAKVAPMVGPGSMQILKNSVTPAGIDYIMTSVGGMLGQDALVAISQAVEAESKGYVPAKEELPIVSRVFAGYPSSNVAPLRRFYERAETVQTVGATIDHLTKEDPTRLAPYMASNQADYVLVGLYTKARQDIANYRRAYQDIKDAPAGTLSSDDRRGLLKQYQILMIETARQSNAFASEVDKAIAGRGTP